MLIRPPVTATGNAVRGNKRDLWRFEEFEPPMCLPIHGHKMKERVPNFLKRFSVVPLEYSSEKGQPFCKYVRRRNNIYNDYKKILEACN